MGGDDESLSDIFRHVFLRAEATQDQEIARAVEWLNESNGPELGQFWLKINDAEPSDIAAMTDDERHCLRALALIGFHEVVKAALLARG